MIRMTSKMQKTNTHEFGRKIGHTNFRKPYLELRATKTGRRGLDGNIEE
jgi:hypothetical protein